MGNVLLFLVCAVQYSNNVVRVQFVTHGDGNGLKGYQGQRGFCEEMGRKRQEVVECCAQNRE